MWHEGHISKGLMLGEWEGRGGLDWETSRRYEVAERFGECMLGM